MQPDERDELLNAGLNRRLTPEEEAQLQQSVAAVPGGNAALEDELALNHLVRQLPNPRLSSNFTAQVLQMAEREHRVRPAPAAPWWHGWLPTRWPAKGALAIVAFSLTLFSYQQYQENRRETVARSIATVSTVAALPVDVLQNFEAINQLHQVPQQVDLDLLAALQ